MESVIGVDPSLGGLCVCVMREDGSHKECLCSEGVNGFGSIVTERAQRYSRLAHNVAAVIIEERPSVIFLEGYSYGSKGAAILSIAEFGGVLRDQLTLGIEAEFNPISKPPLLVEVPPTVLKKYITGKGTGKKVGVIAACAKRYGVEFDTDDEYDAYALARMAAVYAGFLEPETAFQAECIAKLKNPPTPKKKKAS